jgi:threonyl-tRNA synthetase
MVTLVIPGGGEKAFDSGLTVAQMVGALGPHIVDQFIAAKVDQHLVDLHYSPPEGARVELVSADSPAGLEVMRHSAAHIMAQAVLQLYPGTKLAIGPSIEDGFYYDFDLAKTLSEEDLKQIEERMADIIRADLPFTRQEMATSKAKGFFQNRGEKYKVELLQEIHDPTISLYQQGDFIDLCRGPHLPSTSKLKVYKLLSVAGAYWRGNEHNPMLQRIYGTAFPTKEALEAYLHRIEEAKRRDHRKLGKELDLFSLHEDEGAGLIYWHPKGSMIRRLIEDFWKDEHLKRGYQLVNIPHIARINLWERSGHTQFYKENMYIMQVDEQDYVLKPMNCPGHIMIYQTKIRSWRDLPVRYAEMGTVYRYERSGTLQGLMRVRGFTQDDAHIFCTPEQVGEEILAVVDLAAYMLKTFGYEDYEIDLSVRDPADKEKYLGSDQDWERAEGALMEALDERHLKYTRREGEAVFYGPKIDIKLVDAIGRTWQGSTTQFDFNLPARFNVSYTGPDNAPHHVIMIHRAVLGSLERFFGGLIEHYAGAFPMWLAPVQAVVLPITERHHAYAREVAAKLEETGLRVEIDDRNEKIGYKIREGEVQKIPYMLVVGDKEMASGQVSVRARNRKDLGSMALETFREQALLEVKEKIIKKD